MQKMLANWIILFHQYIFCFFFLSLKKRACAFNTWIEKNIYSRHNKCYIAVIRQAKWWWSHALPFTKFTEGFTSVLLTSQFRSVQSWIFSMLLFSKSFISFKIRATLYLSSWNFATGTWNRRFSLTSRICFRNSGQGMPMECWSNLPLTKISKINNNNKHTYIYIRLKAKGCRLINLTEAICLHSVWMKGKLLLPKNSRYLLHVPGAGSR